jgi:hypothetical protein
MMMDDKRRVGGSVVWVAVGLTGLYIAIHLPMLYRSLIEWGRLVSALVGQ